MTAIQCVRCGSSGEPPALVSVTGALKEKILSSICNTCWEEWKKMSVMVINEYKLTPFLPQHREVLEKQMKEFLGL